jgi:hypothetical protein
MFPPWWRRRFLMLVVFSNWAPAFAMIAARSTTDVRHSFSDSVFAWMVVYIAQFIIGLQVLKLMMPASVRMQWLAQETPVPGLNVRQRLVIGAIALIGSFIFWFALSWLVVPGTLLFAASAGTSYLVMRQVFLWNRSRSPGDVEESVPLGI